MLAMPDTIPAKTSHAGDIARKAALPARHDSLHQDTGMDHLGKQVVKLTCYFRMQCNVTADQPFTPGGRRSPAQGRRPTLSEHNRRPALTAFG